MKKNITSYIIISLLLISIGLHAQSDEVLIPYDQATMSKGLMVNINVGDIEIKGTDRSDILIRYDFLREEKPVNNEVTADGLKRISISKSSVDINTEDDRIVVSSLHFNKRLQLYIEVPKSTNIQTQKGGPGELLIDNIVGNINLENNSGSILATNIDGIVNASTNEGDIKVEFIRIPQEYRMIFVNIMGDLEIVIPKDHNTTFLMKTTNGELLTNLDLQMGEQETRNMKDSNRSKGFSYSNNTWTNATLNAGGPEMMLSSMTGNIIIRGR